MTMEIALLILLVVMSVVAVFVAWRRGMSGSSGFGLPAAYLCLALILTGVVWNVRGGFRVPLTLGPGEIVSFAPDQNIKLFSVKTELPEPTFRLYAYVVPNGKGGFEARPKEYPAVEGFHTTLSGTNLRMDVERLIPNAVDAGQWVENPSSSPNPALRVLLGLGVPDPPSGILLAKSQGDDRIDEPLGRFAVIFRESWNEFTPVRLGSRPPLREKLVLELDGQIYEQNLDKSGPWRVEGYVFHIVNTFADFAIRRDAKGNPQPYSASNKAKDPWLQLKMECKDGRTAKLLLSAWHPDVTDRLNRPNLPGGARLRYVREGEDPQDRFVVFTHDDAQVRLMEGGRLKRQEPFALKKPFVVEKGLSVTPVTLLERAEYQPEYRPHPDPELAKRFVHPALSVKLTDPTTGRSESRWLEVLGSDDSLSGATFMAGRVGLLFRPHPVEPQNLRSEIGLLDGQGRELMRNTVLLGEPVRLGNLEIRQLEWMPGDAETSRILVLREPGRGLITLGIWLLLCAVLWTFILEMRLRPIWVSACQFLDKTKRDSHG